MISINDVLQCYPEVAGVHPAADFFRLPTIDELTHLVSDMKEHGLRHRIVLEEGTNLLIDGRSRLMACYEAQVEPKFEITAVDPLVISISENSARRNLTTWDKGQASVKIEAYEAVLAKERQVKAGEEFGENHSRAYGNVATSSQGKARDAAAVAVGVSPRTVSKCKVIVDNAPPEVIAALDNHKLTVEGAYKAVRPTITEKPPKITQELVTIVAFDGETATVNLPKKTVFNKTNENVDWAGYTWNPVTGCNHGCKFCYAEGIATMKKMLPFYPLGFKPVLHEYRLKAPRNTRVDGRVFVCSMADLFGKWVPDEWIQKVFSAAMSAPEWEYLFLTKWPTRYKMLTGLPKAWFGASIIKQADVARVEREMKSFTTTGIKWVSLEPMLEPIVFSDLSWCDAVVIGSQTSANGQPAFAPHFDWIVDVVIQCRAAGVKYYLKPNLMEIAPGMVLPRELPSL